MDEFGKNQDQGGFEQQHHDASEGPNDSEQQEQFDAILQSTQREFQESSFAQIPTKDPQAYADEQKRLQESLPGPDVASQMTEEEPEVALQSTMALPAQAEYSGDVSLNVPTEVRQAAKAGLLGAGAGAAAYGGVAAYNAVNAGATAGAAATLGGTAALSGASTVGLGALWLYGGGMLHNLAWGKPGAKKPGAIGTMARGVFWPVTTAAGVVWRHVLRR